MSVTRRVLTAQLLTGLAASGGAMAQTTPPAWPARPVSIVVPFVPGGPSDLLARALAGPLQAAVGQSVLVENRAGANGVVAVQYVTRQPADGHTLFIAASGLMTITPVLAARPPFDPENDLTALTLAISAPNVLVVNPSLPATNLTELIAWLKANPTRASYGSSGIGSSEHLGMELFKLRTGTEQSHIPYPGGGAAVTDLIAGTLQLSLLNLATVAPHVQGGRLRAIAVGGARRHPLLPDVPTFAEAGLADYTTGSWHGIVTPRGLPAPLQARMEETLRTTLRNPEIAARLAATGFTVEATDAATLSRTISADLARWREVVRSAGISVG
ncbi:Bug family tripartite tricarboxylate transporter substrate binding protein [Sediminicoccus rosea]|jgi:tripartite-type tricarboxylate transporter receptor subunit TctC|uniref:Tripartite tricarboxylate transporter substrate binding protein n=1 Tax=Sediminicoccus rosea TaxID=1225128 RepID=A0ABZ0PLY0_9PROT|nr:tripartite tricarboxylate transporter substrate binding protein [Sediminicoccus rosea]WPB86724.1 tripartite tricarboxylate transporter substrate binding protein [Sediminicoccus rosea]